MPLKFIGNLLGNLFGDGRSKQQDMSGLLEYLRRSADEASRRADEHSKSLMAFMQKMQTMEKEDPEKYRRLKDQLNEEKNKMEDVKKMLDTAKKEALAAFPSHEIVPANLVKKAKLELGMDIENDYNIGFPGSSGQGKSSLINAIRGLKAHQPGAAPVSIVECTCRFDKYDYPNAPHLKLWDIPGTGTVKHSGRTYFLDKYLYAYDSLVIVSSTRCSSVDLHLANVAAMYGIPTAIVRNKVDGDYESHCKIPSLAGASDADIMTSFRKTIMDDFTKNCAAFDASAKPPKLFLVSCKEWEEEDETRFDEGLLLEWLHIQAKSKLAL